MTVHFRKSFVADLGALDPLYRERIERSQLKKLKGRPGFFRIRVGDYRVGLAMVGEELTLVRCLNRKEFYRHFP